MKTRALLISFIISSTLNAVAAPGLSLKAFGGSSLREGASIAYNPALIGGEIGLMIDQVGAPVEISVSLTVNPERTAYEFNSQTQRYKGMHVMGGINYWVNPNFGAGALVGYTKEQQTLINPGSGVYESYNAATLGLRVLLETNLLPHLTLGTEAQLVFITNFYSGVVFANLAYLKLEF